MLVNSMYLVTAINEEQDTYDKGQKVFHNFGEATGYARKLYCDLNGMYTKMDPDYSFIIVGENAMFTAMDPDPYKSWKITVEIVEVGD